MYNIISGIIDHVWNSGSSEQSYIMYACVSIIIILTVVFIDLVYRVFRSFWKR